MTASVMNLRKAMLLSALLLATLLAASEVRAQQETKQEPAPVSNGAPPPHEPKKETPPKEHRFWDSENRWLFAAVGGARGLDYSSTLNMRRRGRQEIFLSNDAVDNHPAFAAIEAAAVGTSVGASFLFHRYGHHKLERWTSFVHIGLATTGAVRNYCLKTAHPRP